MTLGAGADAKTIEVNSPAFLLPALKQAQSGDTLSLAPGQYGRLTLTSDKMPAANGQGLLTISSRDQERPATFFQMKVDNASNISLTGLKFSRPFTPDSQDLPALHITQSSNVWIFEATFEGSNASGTKDETRDGFPAGTGILVEGSKRIAVEQSQFKNLGTGLELRNCEDVLLAENELLLLRAYGLEARGARNITVTGNHIHDFKRSAKDSGGNNMIHFGTEGASTASENIKINYNFLDSGAGSTTQSILLANEVLGKNAKPSKSKFRKVDVVGNIVRNGHLHGISVAEGDGFRIAQNTILQNGDQTLRADIRVPRIDFVDESKNLTIENNIVPVLQREFRSLRSGWKFANNYEAQRDAPAARNHYQNVFVNALAERTLSLADLEVVPASIFAGKNIGSQLLVFNKTPERPSGFIANGALLKAGLKQRLTLKLFGPDGEIAPDRVASVAWNFGDKSNDTSKGLVIDHHFQKRGKYDLVARATLVDQSVIEVAKTVIAGN